MTDPAAALRELAEPWSRGDRVKVAIDRAARRAGLVLLARIRHLVRQGPPHRTPRDRRHPGRARPSGAKRSPAMRSTISGPGSPGSRRYWFKRTRNSIGLFLIGCGHRMADWAEWVAPWLENDEGE